MKRTRRTLLSLALCAALCLSLLPGTARAEDTGYSFDPNSGTLTITTDEGTTAWRKSGTGIAADNVTAVVVGDGVTVIQRNAFYNCWNLSSVTLPDGVTAIGGGAFYQCTSLVSVAFPATLNEIGTNAFSGSGLTSADLSGTKLKAINSESFTKCQNLTEVKLPEGLTTVGKQAFRGSGKLWAVTFPSSLTSIEDSAFAHSGLASLDLPEDSKLASIGEEAFLYTRLLSADLSCCSNLLTISKGAFFGNGSLKEVKLPDSLRTMEREVFYNCKSLSSVTFLGDAPELGAIAFESTAPDLAIFVPKGATGYTDGGWTNYSWRVVSGAALSGLILTPGSLEPAFHPGHTSYTLSLPYDKDVLRLSATARSGFLVDVNGVSHDMWVDYPLELGETKEIVITVKKEDDDQDTRTYTICATRAPLTVIDISAVSGVTAPVRGAAPVTEAAETEQCTGTVAWTPDPGGAFAADTAYTATITLTPKPGYTLEGVGENFFTAAGAASVSNAAGSGVITAVFPKTDPAPSSGGSSYSYYAVTPTAGEGGAIDPAEPVRVRQGKDQTFTITPAEGYAVADVLVDGESVGAVETYTFEKVKARHTIEAVFAPAWVNPFTDVAEDDWFYGPVAWAQGAGVMTGTAADTFEPEAPVTRAALVTTLYRLAGKPQGGGEGSPFTDIPSGQWYSGAAAWAVDAGVTQGVGGGRFDPDGAVTREQLFTLLYRFALYQKRDVSMGEDTNILSYTDAMDLAEWAVPAFQWACGAGVTEGTQDGRLAPEEVATRAQLAAVLERYAGA